MRQIEGASHLRTLKRKFKKLPMKYRKTSAPWISDTTCNMAYERTSLGSKSRANQEERRVLTRRFQAALWRTLTVEVFLQG